MATKNVFFIFYPDSPWFYGHYGVLHNLLSCFYFPRCYAWMHKNNKFPFYKGCHGNQNTFCDIFSFDYVRACLDGYFGVLSCFCYPRCYAIIIKNNKFQLFNCCHGNQNMFFYIFSFDYVRTCLDGHFGVLHDTVHHLVTVQGPKNYKKMLKISVFWLPW